MISTALFFAGIGAMALLADRQGGGSAQYGADLGPVNLPAGARAPGASFPPLPFAYDALQPWSSAETVRLHHDKLQASYVRKANNALQRMGAPSPLGEPADVRARRHFGANMSLVFNTAGAMLHQLFWENLSPGPTPIPPFLEGAIRRDFGSMAAMQQQTRDLASLVGGSGWIVLVYSPYLSRLVLLPVLKHQNNWIPGSHPLMVLDLWEHAYYLDHPADRMSFVDGFWRHVNWPAVNERLRRALQG